MSTEISKQVETHKSFILSKAKIDSPSNMPLLFELLKQRGESLVPPNERKGLNPFLIPLTKNLKDGSSTCYLRWPTMKEGTPLQVVRTNEFGVSLISLDTDKYCHRLVVELDFAANPNSSVYIEKLNKIGINYKSGDYMAMLKSGNFPSATEENRNLILDRYLLTKVGPFPDCFERLAENFLKTGSEVSAFVTCERAISVFYGWGHPMKFNAFLMTRIKGRESEAVSKIQIYYLNF
jgi:hypothetical protein